DGLGVEHVGDEPAQCRVGFQGVLDGGVLGVDTHVLEQFDGQLELVAVGGVGPVGDVVGDAAQHVDVVLGDLDPQRPAGGGGPDVVVGGQVRQVVVVFVGE